jgi:hypothetical protein
VQWNHDQRRVSQLLESTVVAANDAARGQQTDEDGCGDSQGDEPSRQ